MYERPQYLTPDGFRRSRRDPSFGTAKQAAANILAQRKKMDILKAQGHSGISPEAARLIALAISGMLKQDPRGRM